MINSRYFANLSYTNSIMYAISVLFLVFTDIVTKLYYNKHLSYGSDLNVLPFLNITLIYNYGASFGLLSDQNQEWQKYLLISIGIIASIFMIIVLYKLDRNENIASIRLRFATILILSGTLGNVLDRITHGYVIDFISLHYNNIYLPVFNIADITISLGFLIFIANNFFSKNLNIYKK
ncbi:signal peptidase II [Candidatus Kinetoplastibacterium blastocrithidii TCC012E]|uniref:Lipoprotein signal peptidase n=2 Tax=Candidatus Kinetoplastidibacterium blastocrithidiae TaxID=233181 RepID=M1MD18_9PROT|nr:lipoprotein signal peptidase protein [Candidatus Kinetoplastibacterium blastocrithidii (ex Strigomonas culicis)]AGF49665.1 signal peptidase II [Candidatus Kinetoplastibacterium blastocrithidii TCC012E]